MTDKEIIENQGYLLKKSLLSKRESDIILSFLKDKKASINIPFSNVPWGYGNLIKEKELSFVYENEQICKICKAWLGDEYIYNHLMINNKASFIGPDVEWHQEEFNIDTFAPGAKIDDTSWRNFLQIYIALDDQNLENGCLRIIPSSHKLGVLEHEDIVNVNYSHKRRVPFDIMRKIYEQCGYSNVLMKKGDVLFFTHRLVHGSSSNISPFERRAIVMQARLPFQKSEVIFEIESQKRRDFVTKSLSATANDRSSSNKNIYDDFEEKK